MKRLIGMGVVGVSAMLLLSGCIVLALGTGDKTRQETKKATVGQELMDLQKAKDSGLVSQQEYDAQRAKILKEK